MFGDSVQSKPNPYMGDPVEMAEAPNGAITTRRLLEGITEVSWMEPTIEEPADGVWVFGAYGFAPISVIDGDDGLIVVDTGDSRDDGEALLEAVRTVTDKPVSAIIYGHSHTTFGAGVFAEGNDDVMVIGHPNLNAVVEENIQGGGAPSFFPELGPYLTARAATQFNAFVPDEGPDAWVTPLILAAPDMAFLPVNTPVEDGQEMTVAGVRMQFFTSYGSDDHVHTTVWLPDREIVFTTLLWQGPPQLYSLRGDVFRDPRHWIDGLKFTRDLQAEVLVSLFARPVVGRAAVQERLEGYMDGVSFVLDQTLRGILGGKTPDELRHLVTLPDYLDAVPNNLQTYGEIPSYPPAIYHKAVGWYNNDAATLKPLHPTDEAQRLVTLMGGRDAVLSATSNALDNNEYAWAAQLANYLYRLDPTDREARQSKAEALRQMAYVATGSNDRSHLMTQALALEDKVSLPQLAPPPSAAIQASPVAFVDYLRVRLDPSKSGETDTFIRFEFGESGTAALHIRRAVAEYVADPDAYHREPDIVLTMSGASWARLYLNQVTPEELIEKGELQTSSASQATKILGLFDRYQPEQAVVIPRIGHQ